MPPRIATIQPRTIVTFGVYCAGILALATAIAQVIDYGLFDLRIRALNSNTHASVFGAVSLLANAVAVAVAIALAARVRDLERGILAGVLTAMLALRVSAPPHILILTLPLVGIALVILWRQGAHEGGRAIRVGCLLLVLSFVIHASELGSHSPLAFDIDSWAYQLRCVVKHDAELAGWILIAAGLLNVRNGSSQRRPASRLELTSTRGKPVSHPRRAG